MKVIFKAFITVQEACEFASKVSDGLVSICNAPQYKYSWVVFFVADETFSSQ